MPLPKHYQQVVNLYPELAPILPLLRNDDALIKERDDINDRLPKLDKEIAQLIARTPREDTRGMANIGILRTKVEISQVRLKQIDEALAMNRQKRVAACIPGYARLGRELDALENAAKEELFAFIRPRVSATPDGVFDADQYADFVCGPIWANLDTARVICQLRDPLASANNPDVCVGNLFSAFEELDRARSKFPKSAQAA